MQDVLERDGEGRLVVNAPDFELRICREASGVFDGIEPGLIEFNLLNGAELSLSVYRSYRSERKRAGAVTAGPAQDTETGSVDGIQKVTPQDEIVNPAVKGGRR